MAQLMYRIANEPPVDPVSLNRDLPEGVVAVLQPRARQQKQDRFASGAEMAEAASHVADDVLRPSILAL